MFTAGFVGGLGGVPRTNIGEEVAIFEPVHGSALYITDMNIANPKAIIISGVMMLRYLGELEEAERVEKAVEKVLEKGINTIRDLKGRVSTLESAELVMNAMEE
jgi:isocitrate dehydrogenase (NAD+)